MLIFALIFLFLFVPYGALIDYYRRAWNAIPLYFPGSGGSDNPLFTTRISVLVPARNEEANIAACLNSLSGQSYSKDLYEVIVIDDHSTDRTADIVKEWANAGARTDPFIPARQADKDTGFRLKCLQPADPEPGAERVKAHKKFAIETGARMATGELIVTTDADCRFPPDWLRTIAGFYEDTGAKFIAAPVKIGFEPAIPPGALSQASPSQASPSPQSGRAPSLLSIFQTLDFITLQGITGAAVYKNFHSMCNGANLAYSKEAFLAVDGFRGIDQIPSGDDMFLMYKIYKKYPGRLFFLKSREATVSTKAETSWGDFINQRIRWASKAGHYEDRRIFWTLLLVYLLNIAFLCSAVAAFWDIRYLWIVLAMLIGKTLIEFPFVRSAALFFGQQRLMPWFPAMQPLHILYTIAIGWLGKFGSYRWNQMRC